MINIFWQITLVTISASQAANCSLCLLLTQSQLEHATVVAKTEAWCCFKSKARWFRMDLSKDSIKWIICLLVTDLTMKFLTRIKISISTKDWIWTQINTWPIILSPTTRIWLKPVLRFLIETHKINWCTQTQILKIGPCKKCHSIVSMKNKTETVALTLAGATTELAH